SSPATFLSGASPLHEIPELALADDGDDVPAGGEAPDLHQLQTPYGAGDLQRIGPSAHQHVGGTPRSRLHDCPRTRGGGDRLAARPVEETREGDPFAAQILHPPELRCGARVLQRRNQIARGLVTLAAYAEAAVDDFLQMIAAGQRAHVAAAYHAPDVA